MNCRPWTPFCAFAVSAVGGLGCLQGDFGESITVPPDRRMRLAANTGNETTITVPANEKFNLAAAQRQSTDDCRSASFARQDGTASCGITVSGSGDALAEFQLGHVIHHGGGQSRAATIHFDCEYSYEISGAGAGDAVPGLLALKIYIRDSHKRRLHKELLVSHDDALGARRRSGRASPSFDLSLEPDLSYHLVVAGRVEGEADGRQAPFEARIDVRRLEVRIELRDSAVPARLETK